MIINVKKDCSRSEQVREASALLTVHELNELDELDELDQLDQMDQITTSASRLERGCLTINC
jgi:hypothetical protein